MHFGIRAWTTALITAAALSASSGAWAAEATLPTGPGAQPGVPFELRGKPLGGWAKADGAIRGLVAEFQARGSGADPSEFRPSNTTLQFTRGRVVVDIVAADDAEALLQELRRMGMQNASTYGKVISGQLPVGVLSRVVGLPGLQAISAARKPHTNALAGEGATAMYADQPPASGYTGAGITIGVLSDSFDYLNGYAGDQASGDLPAGINVLDDSASPGIDEGRAMMQLAYDVAPGANFAFHTAFGGMADFATGIEELAASGADVIVDDVIYFAEPMFQDGIIARAVDNVVANGVPYFSSAGNQARQSYEATYVDSGEEFFVDRGAGLEYMGRLHDFDPDPGTSTWYQEFYVPQFSSHRVLSLILQWDEPFASLSTGGRAAQIDVDIYLTTDADPSTLIASSLDSNRLLDGGSGEPIELLQFQVGGCDMALQFLYGIGCLDPAGTYRLLISFYDGGNPNMGPNTTPGMPGKLKYVLYDSNITWAHATDSSTVYGHSNAAGAEAVGAAYWQATPAWNCDFPAAGDTWDDCEMNVDGQVTPQLEWFSSAGPTDILFDADGFAAFDPRPKPEIVGPDGTNTTFFYSDTATDPDDFPNFFGTSASAPHLAAVAALMLEADSTLTPTEIYGIIEGTALNMNPRSGLDAFGDIFDDDTGWGFVQADLAIAAVTGGFDFAPTVAVTDPADGATVIGTVTVMADASDDNGVVTQVEFFVGGVSIGKDTDDTDGWSSAPWDSTTVVDGSYAVKATATDTIGQTASHSVNVTVNNVDDPPTVAVTNPADGAMVSGTITVTANASDDNGVDQVEFFVDDVSIGIDANSTDGWSVSWDTTGLGDHTVSATAMDATEQTASDSVNVTVIANDPPVASFTVTENPCLFDPQLEGWVCQFNNTSTDDGGIPALSWVWDYGDNTFETAVWSPDALYTVPGTYPVTLTVTDAFAASIVSDSVVVQIGAPTASAGVHIGNLTDESVGAGRGRWDAVVKISVVDADGDAVPNATVDGLWSNGANGPGSCPTTDGFGQCTITMAGLKGNASPVDFTVTSVSGTGTFYDSANGGNVIFVTLYKPGTASNASPVASFTDDGCPGGTCGFTDTSSDSDGSIALWSWNFGDSVSSNEQNPSHTYTVGGNYTVTLTVTDDGGATDSISRAIDVVTSGNQPPVAAYRIDTVPCEWFMVAYQCSFTDISTDSDGTVVSRFWNFQNGITSTQSIANSSYPVAGDYPFTLIVIDDDGDEGTVNGSVHVGNPTPPPLVLESAAGYKVKGKQKVDLTWSGATVGAAIYRDGLPIETNVLNNPNSDSGSYTDNIDQKGGGSYSYVVCEGDAALDDASCSAPPTTVVF